MPAKLLLKSTTDNRYTCSCCGQEHRGIPTSFAADYPDNYAKLTPDERDMRAILGSDQCVIDSKEFYIRGCLEIPILGTGEIFLWGLWANMWEADYDTIADHWETPHRETLIGPFKGRLANSLSVYTETTNLKLTIKVEPVGTRPHFIIDEPEHPLAREQAEGITLDTARRYACMLLQGGA